MFILRNIDCLRKPILYFVRIFIDIIFFFFVIVICSFCIAIVYTKLQYYVKRFITIKKNIFYNNKLPTSPPDSPNFE